MKPETRNPKPETKFWRSLEEYAETQEFREFLQREYPSQVDSLIDPVSRRRFLQLMGASLALAGLSACGTPAPTDEKIVPYVQQPEEIVLGKPLFFATAFPMSGGAAGILVESHEGRPTKVEGNSQHPASLGATDAFAQASILTLYDPDRSQVVSNAGSISTWSAFLTTFNGEVEKERLAGGAGLHILTESVTSPTLADQLRRLLAKFPKAKWHQYEPVSRDNVRAGARLAFGEYTNTHYRLDKADVILTLDGDFLFHGPGSVRYARDFAARRRVRAGQSEMNRLYAVEATPSITGAMADHRLALPPSEIPRLTRSIATRLEIVKGEIAEDAFAQWVNALVRDLRNHRGASLVIAGDQQPPEVHALAHAMNHVLDNVGQTVFYTEPIEANPVDQMASLRDLVKDMEAGQVHALVMLGGNPVFTAPADLRFAEHLSKVAFRAHLSLYDDETSALCHWHIPETHYLESWGDARAYDGTVTILQPLIAPLYRGKSAHELLAVLLGQPGQQSYEIVHDYWKSRSDARDFETFWRTALHDGVMANTALPAKPVRLKTANTFDERSASPTDQTATRNPQLETRDSLEIAFRPDPTIFDGRFANNGWLQELPKPLTKLTWDNAVLMSPATAQRLGIEYRIGTTGGEHGRVHADLLELSYRGRTIQAPAWIVPGHADNCVTLHFGYGRARAGRVGSGAGFNAYAIWNSDDLWQGAGAAIRKVGQQYTLACTQFHHNMEGRNLVRAATIEEYRKDPDFLQKLSHHKEPAASLYPPHPYEGYAWGMTIDVNACTGCNACVVACQAENNIPIVGKTEVTRGREMHWLRIDRYYKGSLDNPEAYHQPVPCMHCENAPCELVCPVGATNHSHEGLNDMVYNRCVGTRYCSNNCPYKVRRFNFLQYSDWETESLKPMRNPDVTVRSRGVMEKCTYCVQRINSARIQAEKEDRAVRDGEIVTACQAACPSEAIVFGDINDSVSRVAKLKDETLNYGLLTELNTKPRTTYLAKLKNPNPEIKEA